MAQLRITGLVKLATAVRAAGAHGAAPDARDALRRAVERALRQVADILAAHNASEHHLPPASRRALDQLRAVRWDQIPLAQATSAPAPLRLAGVTAYVDDVARRLSLAAPNQLDKLHRSITLALARLDGTVERAGIPSPNLTPATRAALGWLRLLADPVGFGRYVQAMRRCERVITPKIVRDPTWPPPIRYEYKIFRGGYRLRAGPRGTLVTLSLSFLAFDSDDQLTIIASRMLHDDADAKRRFHELTMTDAHQAMLAQVESLEGIATRDKGAHHDLSASFDRVNARYFAGAMAHPRLAWSQSLTGRKFGHYEWLRDTVVVSSTLDTPAVPAFVVDFIVYHELLHKKWGLHWVNGRGMAHRREFREDEQRFERLAEAHAVLTKLATAFR